MARMTKNEKLVDAAFNEHFNRVPVNVMKLSEIYKVGMDALEAGEDLDAAMIAAVPRFRMG